MEISIYSVNICSTEFGWDSEGRPIRVDEVFPEDVKELLMLDSDAKSCDEDESNQYQEMDESEMILRRNDYDTEDDKKKDSDDIVIFFKIKSLIKCSTT